MIPRSNEPRRRVRHTAYWALVTLAVVRVLCGGVLCANAQQCSFTSPSDGSDGDYDLSTTPSGSTVYFSASGFKGSGVANNVFNFGKISIPAGVTVKFTEKVFHGPVYGLAASDVTIAVEWTPKLRQANKTHFPANGEWSYGSESTEVHAGV